MRRETQNVLLILVGGALLKLAFSGDYLNYVLPKHQPWMIGGGVAILLLGAAAIWRDLRTANRAAADEHHEHEADAHGHDHSSSKSTWLLLVPVLAVLFVAPPALGANSVNIDSSQGRREPSETVAYPPLPKDKVTSMPISEFQARAAWDDTKTLHDRTVALRGFIVHKGQTTYVARMVIGCCAADGYPVMVRLGGAAAAEFGQFDDDDWVTVTGQFVPGSATAKNRNVPELAVEEIRRVAPPADPYES